MKRCSYCGRDSDDAAAHCGECGTVFAIVGAVPPATAQKVDARPLFIDLESLPGAFVFQEGFSRPDWKAISAAIKANVGGEQRALAWEEVLRQWLARLALELGGDYKVRLSERILFLSACGAEEAGRILRAAEHKLQQICDYLDVAWYTRLGPRVILLFAEDDDYYQYISSFYPDGMHPTSGGLHLRSGYPHIALKYYSEPLSVQIIAHELAHNCLEHLPIPSWVNEGVAMAIESIMGTSQRQLLADDLPQRHHHYWDEKTIQAFWAGTAFHQAGEACELSYSLAAVLMELLPKDRANLLAFIQSAHRDDAGQTAALDCLGVCLGQTAATFLGPGNWRPQRKAIKECWDQARAAQKPASRRAFEGDASALLGGELG